MNGELIIKGYKFSEKLMLNLQDKTVLTGVDTFTPFEVFNMLENYFNRRNFSDYYLDKGTVLVLNGNKLSGSEFAVFRLHPIIDLSEELKIGKKSILGQAVEAIFAENHMSNLVEVLGSEILIPINSIIQEYGVSFSCGDADIFTVARLLQPKVKVECGQDILQQEHNQFYCKAMLLDLITKLNIDKKKMLLVEFPEYGLKQGEVFQFLELLSITSIDNVIIYTHDKSIYRILSQVFNYNFIKNGKIYGFDDYDELEMQLRGVLVGSSAQEIEHKVIEYMFDYESSQYSRGEFKKVMENFMG